MAKHFSPTSYSRFLTADKNEAIYKTRLDCGRIERSLEGEKEVIRRKIAKAEETFGFATLATGNLRDDLEKEAEALLQEVRAEIQKLMQS